MIAALAVTTLLGAVSAVLPVAPIEPYLLGAAVTTGVPPACLGVAAALGQTAGKLLIFLLSRGALRSGTAGRLLRRRLREPAGSSRARTALATLDRPRHAVSLLLVSSATGFPPLLMTSVYLARSPMPAGLFTVVCLLGRSLRFTALAFAPGLFLTVG
ncbi:hypothetical protein [Actinocorallia longicatena]|uniref:SNARE associated Golgi protein n=1 Tax=Actinocorallia longicatena TaxID=111803 RepID=A0ABP6QEW6_9ACTN